MDKLVKKEVLTVYISQFTLIAVALYEQFGFVKRPNESEGCGMNLVIVKE